MGSGHDSLIRFACAIFISVLNVPFPTHGIEHLAGKWGQSIFKALKVCNLTGEIWNLLFPAFDIINVTGQLGQAFAPTLWVFGLALDDSFELPPPTVVVLRSAMVSEIANVFVHLRFGDNILIDYFDMVN